MNGEPEGGAPAAPAQPTALPAGERPASPDQRRFGVGPQIYSGLLGSVVLVILASFVAYFFPDRDRPLPVPLGGAEHFPT